MNLNGPNIIEILKDNYDHKKFFAFKSKAVVDAGVDLSIQMKTGASLSEKKTESGCLVPVLKHDAKSWVRFVTPINKFTLDTRIWADSRFKLGLDAGYLEQAKNLNVYGLFRGNFALSKYRAGLGLAYKLENNGYVTVQ
jgi:hypothetical protein